MRRSSKLTTLALLALLSALTLGGSVLALAQSGSAPELTIPVVARRFAYSPNEIVLKRGQPVVLEFTAIDFRHGFNIPGLKLRADLPPDQVTRVRLTPDKLGTFEFLCDNFCGDDHEEMGGRIIVKD